MNTYRWLSSCWKVPRIFVTAICVGVAGGFVVSIYARTVDLIAAPFVWAGCGVVLWLVWSANLTWSQIFRLLAFWTGLALAGVGNLVFYARAK
jgi:hypothetical protein